MANVEEWAGTRFAPSLVYALVDASSTPAPALSAASLSFPSYHWLLNLTP
jgi:hypothetical protein